MVLRPENWDQVGIKPQNSNRIPHGIPSKWVIDPAVHHKKKASPRASNTSRKGW